MREITNHHGSIMYLNSGDWIENLTSLEYNEGKWIIYKFDEEAMVKEGPEEEAELSNNQLFTNMLEEFNIVNVS